MSEQLEKHRPLVRLLLRLMGVFFFIEGVWTMLAYGIDLFYRIRFYEEQNVKWTPDDAFAQLVAGFVVCLLGLYLIYKGQFIMDIIFHEATAKAVAEPDDADDARGDEDDTDKT